jgi:hypothetical protein
MENSSSLTGCKWIASKLGWRIAHGNVMVEGTSDVAYLIKAAELYKSESGLSLIGSDFSVFAAGEADEGGTYGLMERFPLLFSTALLDIDEAGKKRFRVIALADDDKNGRLAVNAIPKGSRLITEYEHIFRLRRVMPRRAGSPKKLADNTRSENSKFESLDCVIEDLLSLRICEAYTLQNPSHIIKATKLVNDGHHTHWSAPGKSGLLRYTLANAQISDVTLLVELLKSLRSYAGLAADGIKD